MSDVRDLFRHTADYAAQFHETLGDRPVHAQATFDELVEALGGPLPDEGGEDVDVVSELIAAGEPGVVGTQTGRYFGFVIGSALPASRRRGLARDGVGPERLLGRRVAGGRRGGGGGGRVARRAARAAGWDRQRLRHRRPGCEHDRARRCETARPGAGGLGRRAGRAARGAADPRACRRRASRHDRPFASAAGPRHRCARARRGGRSGANACGRATRGAGGLGRPGDRLCPGREREHRSRSTRSTRSRTRARPPAPGSTSTARSASGRARARASAT